MKTLDEVIDQLIDCHTNWARWSQTSDIVDRSAVEDALFYLKEYRDDRNDLTALRAYWAEHQANPALTWDELRTMERKPVWVEYNLHISDRDARSRMWIIVQKIMPWRQDDELIYYSGFVFGKKEIGKTWLAYRKEIA